MHIGFRANNQFSFDFYGDGLNAPVLVDTAWHHWAVTFDATSKTQIIYQDGKKVAERKASGLYEGTGDLQIARISITGVNYFNGVLDDLRIWNKVRTPKEIQASKSIQLSGKEIGLVKYFPFNEGKGGVTSDKIASNKLSLKNMDTEIAWIHVAKNGEKTVVIPNYALDFNYLDNLDFGGINLGNIDYTIEFWAKIKGGGTIFSYYKRWNNKFDFRISNSSLDVVWYNGMYYNLSGNNDSNWHHWAYVYESKIGKHRLYKDGVKVGESSGTSDYNYSLSQFKKIDGQVDELRIWKKTRSEQDIKANFKFSLANPKESGLVRYYKFEDNKGNKAKDETGNKDATLNNIDASKAWIKRQ